MAASLKLLPGSTVRWRGRRYLIVDYESLDAIIARQPGKRRLERIPVNEAAPDHASHIVSAWTPDLASVPEEAWQKAVKRSRSTPIRFIKASKQRRWPSTRKGYLEPIIVPASACRIALPNRQPSCSTSCHSKSAPFRSTAS